MIQELLGGASSCLIGGERKISINGTILEGTPSSNSPSLSPSPSSSTTTTIATTTTTTTTNSTNSTAPSTSENLRCPRCDSSNTKFCYYNNYNLTQPRHFCKTCRRYWTKGGALRNVPIGGGCRKNKNTTVPSTSLGKSSAGKLKTVATELGRSGFDNHELTSSPIMWGSPQNSHILALLRATHQNTNPNPSALSNSVGVKEEINSIGSPMMNEPVVSSSVLNGRALGLDCLSQSQVPSLGLCSPFWKNNNHHQVHQQQNGFMVGEAQNNNGLQELYQRLRSTTNYYSTDHSSVVLSNVGTPSMSSSSSSILESAPVAGGELGYWNSAFSSWSDLPTTNGAYP